MTWKHHRGYAPMVAAAARFEADHPAVGISWDQRSLQDFESQPLEELVSAYDLIIIDHPHLGQAVARELLVPLDLYDTQSRLSELSRHSVGSSHQSYRLDDHQWALPIDAAAPVSVYRPGQLDGPPRRWDEVVELAEAGRVLLPLRAPHALLALFWVANNQGFSFGSSTRRPMAADELATSLDCLLRVVSHLDPVCFECDPIAVQDRMSESLSAPDYCPHAYGYVSYARQGFRSHQLRYANTPEIGHCGHAGTVLGGTGIAVSSLCQSKDLAIQFAFWVTSPDVQCGLYFDSGGQPAHGLAWDSDHCNSASSDFFRNTRDTLEGAWIRPRHDGFLNFQETGSRAVSEYLSGVRNRSETIELINQTFRDSYL